MEPNFTIGDRVITEKGPAFVIAEIGSNHGGDLSVCIDMIMMAHRAGADAVKMQKRDNKNLFTKAFYDSPYTGDASFGDTYGKHREALDFGDGEFVLIKKVCDELGIIFFATPFEQRSLDFLVKQIRVPVLKVASCDIRNLPFIKKMGQTGLPIILSTGGATYQDMDEAIRALPSPYPLALLHTVSTYPNKDHELNLHAVYQMRKNYPHKIVGFSTHHPGILPIYLAFMLGARIFEVHVTLNRANKGTDNAFSFEPAGLAKLIQDLKRIPVMLGGHDKKLLPSEEKGFIYKMGKAVHPIKPIQAGEMLTLDNVALRAPADGPPPADLNNYLGKAAVMNISTSDTLRPEMVELITVMSTKYERGFSPPLQGRQNDKGRTNQTQGRHGGDHQEDPDSGR